MGELEKISPRLLERGQHHDLTHFFIYRLRADEVTRQRVGRIIEKSWGFRRSVSRWHWYAGPPQNTSCLFDGRASSGGGHHCIRDGHRQILDSSRGALWRSAVTGELRATIWKGGSRRRGCRVHHFLQATRCARGKDFDCTGVRRGAWQPYAGPTLEACSIPVRLQPVPTSAIAAAV